MVAALSPCRFPPSLTPIPLLSPFAQTFANQAAQRKAYYLYPGAQRALPAGPQIMDGDRGQACGVCGGKKGGG